MTNNNRIQWYRDYILLLVASTVFFSDQVSKAIVLNKLFLGQSIPGQGFVRITRTLNTGTAFGLFQGHAEILTMISVVVIGILVCVIVSQKYSAPIIRVCLGLLLGGAMGNLADRLRLGHVTDFIDIGAWPVFNMADSAIVTGIGVLLALSTLGYGVRKEKELHISSGSDLEQYNQWVCPYCAKAISAESQEQHITVCSEYRESTNSGS